MMSIDIFQNRFDWHMTTMHLSAEEFGQIDLISSLFIFCIHIIAIKKYIIFIQNFLGMNF